MTAPASGFVALPGSACKQEKRSYQEFHFTVWKWPVGTSMEDWSGAPAQLGELEDHTDPVSLSAPGGTSGLPRPLLL